MKKGIDLAIEQALMLHEASNKRSEEVRNNSSLKDKRQKVRDSFKHKEKPKEETTKVKVEYSSSVPVCPHCGKKQKRWSYEDDIILLWKGKMTAICSECYKEFWVEDNTNISYISSVDEPE